jgi:hypothetical protein
MNIYNNRKPDNSKNLNEGLGTVSYFEVIVRNYKGYEISTGECIAGSDPNNPTNKAFFTHNRRFRALIRAKSFIDNLPVAKR